MRATIVLECSTEEEADAIANAVEPDNLSAPKGLEVKTAKQGNLVISSISGDVSLERFIATIDDLLASVQIAERAFRAIRA